MPAHVCLLHQRVSSTWAEATRHTMITSSELAQRSAWVCTHTAARHTAGSGGGGKVGETEEVRWGLPEEGCGCQMKELEFYSVGDKESSQLIKTVVWKIVLKTIWKIVWRRSDQVEGCCTGLQEQELQQA